MQKMQKVTVYVPNKDKNGAFVQQYNEKLNLVEDKLSKHFGGFSFYEGIGVYTNNNDKKMCEAHRAFVVICNYDWAKKEVISSILEYIRKTFKQECVLHTVEELECEFYAG